MSFPGVVIRLRLHFDFGVAHTKRRSGGGHHRVQPSASDLGPAADGTPWTPSPRRSSARMGDLRREGPGMSAFAMRRTSITPTQRTKNKKKIARAGNPVGQYSGLTRAARRNEAGMWWRRHDETQAVSEARIGGRPSIAFGTKKKNHEARVLQSAS